MNIKYFYTVLSFAVMMTVVGCGTGTDWEQVYQLREENSDLKTQVKKLKITQKNLNKQVETLASLEKDVRLEALATLDKIELTDRTGIHDRDDDGKYESLVVYIRPYDTAGDVVKATGSVELQLWDLNADSDGALLAEWDIQPQQLREMWMGMLMTNYYRIIKDVSDVVRDPTKDLTVKVKFTDYLTGRVYNKQMMITGKDK